MYSRNVYADYYIGVAELVTATAVSAPSAPITFKYGKKSLTYIPADGTNVGDFATKLTTALTTAGVALKVEVVQGATAAKSRLNVPTIADEDGSFTVLGTAIDLNVLFGSGTLSFFTNKVLTTGRADVWTVPVVATGTSAITTGNSSIAGIVPGGNNYPVATGSTISSIVSVLVPVFGRIYDTDSVNVTATTVTWPNFLNLTDTSQAISISYGLSAPRALRLFFRRLSAIPTWMPMAMTS